MRAVLRHLGWALRDQGNYASEDGTEYIPAFSASGALTGGYLTPSEMRVAGVTAGAVTASDVLVVDSNKALVSSSSISTGVIQIEMTSDGTTAARALKSRAYGPTSGSCGDLIGMYALAEMQGGATSATSSTIASYLGWTTVTATDTIGSGNVVAVARFIFDSAQDLQSIGGGGRSAIIYGELWGTAGADVNYGLGLQNNLAGNTITSMIWMRSAGDDVTNAIELSNAPYFDSLFEFNAADTDKCIEANTNAITTTETAYHLRITVGGTPYYIPCFDAKTWN